MIEFDKTFEVQGSSGNTYTVRFAANALGIKASCTCAAGTRKQICKHLIQAMENDAEIKMTLSERGIADFYADYLKSKKQFDDVAREVKKLEKSTSKLEMYEKHLDLLKQYEVLKKGTHGLKKKFERILLGD